MRWMEILNKYPWPLYLLVGMFFGYKMLPKMLMRSNTAVVTTP